MHFKGPVFAKVDLAFATHGLFAVEGQVCMGSWRIVLRPLLPWGDIDVLQNDDDCITKLTMVL